MCYEVARTTVVRKDRPTRYLAHILATLVASEGGAFRAGGRLQYLARPERSLESEMRLRGLSSGCLPYNCLARGRKWLQSAGSLGTD